MQAPLRFQRALPLWAPKFLMVLSEHGNVFEACEAAGVSRTHAYDYKNQNPNFAEQWAEAKEISTDKIELEAVTRAVTGMKRLKFDGRGNALLDPRKPPGDPNPYYEERVVSDSLLDMLLKARRPDEYRDSPKLAVNFLVQALTADAERLGVDAKELIEGTYRVLAGEGFPELPESKPNG